MKKIVFIMSCFGLLLVTACNKEMSENFNLYTNHPLNDTIWTKTDNIIYSVHSLFNNLAPDMIEDTFDVGSEKSFRFGDSLEISFEAESCVDGQSPGSAAQGIAKLQLLPLKRKGDFIRIFRPTVAGNGSLLETGGGYFIRISKDDKELSLAGNATFKLRFNDVDTAKLNMQLFYGKEDFPVSVESIDRAFFWIRDYDITPLKTWEKNSNNPLIPSYSGYELISKNIRWVMAGRYADSTQPKTKVTAILSPNFTNKNTAVFAVFANQKTVVNLGADYFSRSFFANNIPLNSAIKLVSLSKIGGDFYLGETAITGVAKVTSYKIIPAKTSLKNILTYLNRL